MRAFLAVQFKNGLEVSNVASSSVAAQVQVDSFDNGLFPYAATEANFVAGQEYPIRYWGGANARRPAPYNLGRRPLQALQDRDPGPVPALKPDESLLAQ